MLYTVLPQKRVCFLWYDVLPLDRIFISDTMAPQKRADVRKNTKIGAESSAFEPVELVV